MAACLKAVMGKPNRAPASTAALKPSRVKSAGMGVSQYRLRMKSSVGFLGSFLVPAFLPCWASRIIRLAFSLQAWTIRGLSPTIRRGMSTISMGLISNRAVSAFFAMGFTSVLVCVVFLPAGAGLVKARAGTAAGVVDVENIPALAGLELHRGASSAALSSRSRQRRSFAAR